HSPVVLTNLSFATGVSVCPPRPPQAGRRSNTSTSCPLILYCRLSSSFRWVGLRRLQRPPTSCSIRLSSISLKATRGPLVHITFALSGRSSEASAGPLERVVRRPISVCSGVRGGNASDSTLVH